ncbi:MATE family efflux transporter [Mesoplasma lactucae]|uniref:Uncharacterized protein n=1 Tax=Mesoplasma lactucae ATCC 49193 TaxID=81460 RepID=A0A291IRT6_9MOLU|nr:MATE family efflux transporter [Mesoplasma lactucae]ATG97401.1 hypothetical protein CP520_01340 [Mesoplasma lactucae ATCC 49193]ATZ20146.1 hypothetical protein MLACT_v1c03250 [Mesoplasma lactucae ATCC 49193]MCL8216894.1 hypothetical protein [Mesoplasma lactucae ATCC 49193]
MSTEKTKLKEDPEQEFKPSLKHKLHMIFYPEDHKEIMKITLVLFFQLFFAVLISQINIMLYSWYDNKSYFPAVNKVTILFNAVQFIPSLIASGALVVGGNLYGQGRKNELPVVLMTGLLVNGLICLIIVAILEGVSPYLLKFVGAKDEPIIGAMYPTNSELDWVTKYFRIQISQLFIMSFTQVFISGLQVVRKQKHIMIGAVMSNVVDVFITASILYWWKANPIFTSIAIPAANLFQLVYMWLIVKKDIGFKKLPSDKWINGKFAKEEIKIGVPMTAEMATFFTFHFVSQGAIAHIHGSDEQINELIDLNRVMSSINQYCGTYLQAIGTAASIMVASSIGKGDTNQAYKDGINTWRLALYGQFIICLIVLALLYPLLLAFNIDKFLITKYAFWLWLILIVIDLGDTVNMTLLRSLWTAGDLWVPLIVSLVTMSIAYGGLPWVVAVTYKGDPGVSLILIYLMNCIDSVTRAGIYIYMWRSKKWMKYAKKI